MQFANSSLTTNMTPEQRAWFYAEYEYSRRDEVIGVLLAIFLGAFGVHQFYLGRAGLGILYICLSWSGLPAIAGWIEAFFMPRRVRNYNAQQANRIASQIQTTATLFPPRAPNATPCVACGGPVDPTDAVCPHCGQRAHPQTLEVS
jgi:TM2 domain-containing membrane protein YozV